jgi:hypothetical protein
MLQTILHQNSSVNWSLMAGKLDPESTQMIKYKRQTRKKQKYIPREEKKEYWIYYTKSSYCKA